MKINKLIKHLKRAKSKLGNVDVKCNSFCGTNNIHVQFKIEEIDGKIEDHINGHGELCLSINITKRCKKKILDGIKEMENLGYTYYRSQYVEKDKSPRSGISPCEWHNPW